MSTTYVSFCKICSLSGLIFRFSSINLLRTRSKVFMCSSNVLFAMKKSSTKAKVFGMLSQMMLASCDNQYGLAVCPCGNTVYRSKRLFVSLKQRRDLSSGSTLIWKKEFDKSKDDR